MRNTKGRNDDNNLVVYMKGVYRNITRVNADRVHKEISEILQHHAQMRKAGESLHIYCRNETEKKRLLAQKDIVDNEVTVTELYTRPRAKYTPRGIILDVDIDMEDDEIRSATSAVTATRITKMIAGQRRKTGQVIVTFEGEELPEYTYMGWRRFRIQTYIPDPTRCYKCQHYGHKAISCQQQEKCPICAGKHNAKNCDKVGKEPNARFQRADTKCANCGGEHPASYRGCPKFKVAKEITKIQATAPTRISYAEAARRQKSTQLEKPKASQAMTMENEASHPENTKTQPTSGECIDNTIAARNNSKTNMNEHRPPSSESKEKKQQNHEDTHKNCVSKTDFHHFIQTMMVVLTQDKPREKPVEQFKQLCSLLFKETDQTQERNKQGQQ